MDLYCYRLVFILLFFFGCEQIENNLLDEITFFEIENSNAKLVRILKYITRFVISAVSRKYSRIIIR